MIGNGQGNGVRRGRPPGLPKETQTRVWRGIEKFSVAEIKQALLANFGNPTLAARALEIADLRAGGNRTITGDAIRYHMERRASLKGIEPTARVAVLDLAEGVVIRALRNGDKVTSRWVLEQLGKGRGYGRSEDLKLLLLDPSKLSIEQLLGLIDPERLTDEQVDAIVNFLAGRFGFDNTDGKTIEHELPAIEQQNSSAE